MVGRGCQPPHWEEITATAGEAEREEKQTEKTGNFHRGFCHFLSHTVTAGATRDK